ncbi:MAG: hypothetical protein ACK4SL_04305 [Candidatus Paceibacteria bacterium]
MFYAAPTIREDKLWQEFEAKIAEIEANPPAFEFIVVPNALEAISLPERINQDPEELKTEFLLAQAKTSRVNEEPPTIFDMPVGETTYIEYINNLPVELQETLFQMHDELRAVTRSLGTMYEQVPLAERIGEGDQVAYKDLLTPEKDQPLVYPSLRVVEAEFIHQVLATQFPTNAPFYQEYVNSYIADGVGYGYYSALEADVAKMVVSDYLAAARQNASTAAVLQSLE